MTKLSRRQLDILAFIKEEVSQKGYPPSVREIGEAVGLASSSTVHGHLARLEKKGLIRRVAAVSIDNLAGSMGNIASVALIMALCDVRYSAFQYALLSALALTPRYALGGPAGWIADRGWDLYYIVSVLLAIPGLVLVWVMRNKIQELDQRR